jgi:hypothetical protein
VDFASDGGGLPIFCLSPLAIHARNLIEDPRCSLVVQMPGWTGLANARVTIFGDVYQLPADMQVRHCSAWLCWQGGGHVGARDGVCKHRRDQQLAHYAMHIVALQHTAQV